MNISEAHEIQQNFEKLRKRLEENEAAILEITSRLRTLEREVLEKGKRHKDG